MGDLIQILIVVGILVFAAVRQLSGSNEEAKKKQAPARRPRANIETEDMMYDETPPTSSPYFSYDHDYDQPPIPSMNIEQELSSLKKETRSTLTFPPIPEEPDNEQEFNIHSTEEVRRGIIWSEILNRKY